MSVEEAAEQLRAEHAAGHPLTFGCPSCADEAHRWPCRCVLPVVEAGDPPRVMHLRTSKRCRVCGMTRIAARYAIRASRW